MGLTDGIQPVKPTKETLAVLFAFIGIILGIGIAIGYYLPH